MVQLSQLDDVGPVNVASVPQRSPFRYPGGKTWLIPRIRFWLLTRLSKPQILIEPFAGGGIVSLTAVFENFVDEALMIELDDQVAAVWRAILGQGAPWLVNEIMQFQISADSVQHRLSRTPRSQREKAFQTLLKNRVYHGGILAPGSGLLKYGENGKGVSSRWYPQTLSRRIEAIHKIRQRFQFIQGDGIEELQRHQHNPRAVFFIDPPYTAGGKRAGTRLYTHNQINHERLFHIVSTLKGDFLMTYDSSPEILALATSHGFHTKAIPMNNTHHDEMHELLISRSLDWSNL